ncbi:MAG: hypothetical protein AAGA25_05850, partial [Planctomycetota bacterium]
LLLLAGLAWRSVWLPVVVVSLPIAAVVCTLGLIGILWREVNALAMVGVVFAGLTSLYGGLMLAGACARGADRRTGVVAVGPMLTLACFAVFCIAGWYVALDDRGLSIVGIGGSGPSVIGLREAGLIVMVGMVVAWFVVLVLGPALLPAKSLRQSAASNSARGELAHVLADACACRPRMAWGLAGVMTLGIGASAALTPKGADTSGFIPTRTEGAVWRERAWVDGGEWDMPVSVLARGMEDAQQRTAKLRTLAEVEQVTGIGRLIPENRTGADVLMKKLESTLGPAAQAAANLEQSASPNLNIDLIHHVRFIRQGLDFLPNAKQNLGEWYPRMVEAAERFVGEAESLDEEQRQAQLDALQNDYNTTRRQAGELVLGMLDDTPLTVSDLQRSGGLFAGWYALPADWGEDDHTWYRIKVSPAAGDADWPSPEAVGTFHDAVRQIEPEVTGSMERKLMRGRSFTALSVFMVAGTGFVLAGMFVVCGLRWRSGLAAGLGIVASGLVLTAGVGWLSQPMTAMSWSLWPAVGLVVGLWVCTRVRSRASVVEVLTLRQTAGGEAFGLVVAAGFLLAAGLRSAHAPGLTATAVAACLAIAIPGLLMLMLIPGNRTPAQSEPS